jgi:hypothetical protein
MEYTKSVYDFRFRLSAGRGIDGLFQNSGFFGTVSPVYKTGYFMDGKPHLFPLRA